MGMAQSCDEFHLSDEQADRVEAIWRAVDQDLSGKLSQTELLALYGGQEDPTQRFIAAADTDGDGCISSPELLRHLIVLLQKEPGQFDQLLDDWEQLIREAGLKPPTADLGGGPHPDRAECEQGRRPMRRVPRCVCEAESGECASRCGRPPDGLPELMDCCTPWGCSAFWCCDWRLLRCCRCCFTY